MILQLLAAEILLIVGVSSLLVASLVGIVNLYSAELVRALFL